VKIVAIADSDSYLKWGASALGGVPEAWEKRLVVLATPVAPSDEQFDAALAGTGFERSAVPVLGLHELADYVRSEKPDAVLLSVRGPVVRVLVRAIALKSWWRGSRAGRPVFLSGMPGISIPATRRAILYRSRVDMIVVHSKREREEFAATAADLGVTQRFGLATLAFLARGGGERGRESEVVGRDIVFAAQAKVPRVREDRLAVLSWLVRTAQRHPDLRVVVKLRARAGEQQTHAEAHPFDTLAEELAPLPSNLVFSSGSMAEHLDEAAALVTVSSTAALEAAALGVPVLVLDDFGVSARLINLVFEGSNLLGNSEELMAARFRLPHGEWLDANYFHEPADETWLDELGELLAERETSAFPLRPESRHALGGALRRAWDRKRVLGAADRSLGGRVALLIGIPARSVYVALRRLRRALAPAKTVAEESPRVSVPSGR
jgi:hypothetical protein